LKVTFEHFQEKLPEKYTTMYLKVHFLNHANFKVHFPKKVHRTATGHRIYDERLLCNKNKKQDGNDNPNPQKMLMYEIVIAKSPRSVARIPCVDVSRDADGRGDAVALLGDELHKGGPSLNHLLQVHLQVDDAHVALLNRIMKE
jgi:hypothetical protein